MILPSHKAWNKKVSTIVREIIGGVSAVSAVIGIITFVQRQNRPTESIQANRRMTVTPFDADVPEATWDTGIMTEQ